MSVFVPFQASIVATNQPMCKSIFNLPPF
ncbi:unnamed protein product [Ectocarpus sp. CCAP 1310/34]|nr:unnamed protein product [Ectocarpus sp. CCAP 1310/34]